MSNEFFEKPIFIFFTHIISVIFLRYNLLYYFVCCCFLWIRNRIYEFNSSIYRILKNSHNIRKNNVKGINFPQIKYWVFGDVVSRITASSVHKNRIHCVNINYIHTLLCLIFSMTTHSFSSLLLFCPRKKILLYFST